MENASLNMNGGDGSADKPPSDDDDYYYSGQKQLSSV